MTSSDKLRAALDPKSVAIVGASDNENKIGGRPLLYLRKQGFRGRLYPINPNRKEVRVRAEKIVSISRLVDVIVY